MIVLGGGTGTPKLLRGLKEQLSPQDLCVAVNTAEDLWISGNYVSPDVDSVLYTLCDMIDEKRWWGIKGDKTLTHDFLCSLGLEETLTIGDKDRSVQIFRSEMLRRGMSLSEATAELAEALGVAQRVVPMSDDPVATIISTPDGELHFQDFWVNRRGKPEVMGLRFQGLDQASPSPAFSDLLQSVDEVLIGPSNPVTSIGPILSLPGVRKQMASKKVVAVSPFVGNRPVSGPASRFMQAMGHPASDEGVIELLGKVDLFVVDKKSSYQGDCVRMNTLMRTKRESLRVAKELVELIADV